VKPALVISERDNVATALEALEVGRALELGGHSVVVHERIPSGHKIALVDIPAGEPVVKYGSAIGLAVTNIAIGTHVHTHNVASRRGRGDLESSPDLTEPGARLAEPVDEANGTPAKTAGGGQK
jgi:altronate dehydratase